MFGLECSLYTATVCLIYNRRPPRHFNLLVRRIKKRSRKRCHQPIKPGRSYLLLIQRTRGLVWQWQDAVHTLKSMHCHRRQVGVVGMNGGQDGQVQETQPVDSVVPCAQERDVYYYQPPFGWMGARRHSSHRTPHGFLAVVLRRPLALHLEDDIVLYYVQAR